MPEVWGQGLCLFFPQSRYEEPTSCWTTCCPGCFSLWAGQMSQGISPSRAPAWDANIYRLRPSHPEGKIYILWIFLVLTLKGFTRPSLLATKQITNVSISKKIRRKNPTQLNENALVFLTAFPVLNVPVSLPTLHLCPNLSHMTIVSNIQQTVALGYARVWKP